MRRAGRSRSAVTEWNTTAGDWGPRRARLWTLENALACARYHNLIHRHCDLVAIANRSNLINSFCSGFIQTDNHRLYKTPTYYAQQLYATLAGDRPLKIDSPLPPHPGARPERHALGRGRCRDPVRRQRQPTADHAAAGFLGIRAGTKARPSRSGPWPTPGTPASPTSTNSFADPEPHRASAFDLRGRVGPV